MAKKKTNEKKIKTLKKQTLIIVYLCGHTSKIKCHDAQETGGSLRIFELTVDENGELGTKQVSSIPQANLAGHLPVSSDEELKENEILINDLLKVAEYHRQCNV